LFAFFSCAQPLNLLNIIIADSIGYTELMMSVSMLPVSCSKKRETEDFPANLYHCQCDTQPQPPSYVPLIPSYGCEKKLMAEILMTTDSHEYVTYAGFAMTDGLFVSKIF
jgi:hypothetical protein